MKPTETCKQGGDLPAFVRPLFASLYQSMRNDPNADPQEVDEYRKLAGLKNQAEFEADRREADEISLWTKGMIGLRFSGALVTCMTDDAFRMQFGEHNSQAKIIRDHKNRIRGFSRNMCMCDTNCLPKFCHFLFANPALEIYAQGNGLYSITLNADLSLRCELRTEAQAFERKRQREEEKRQDAKRQNLIRMCEQQQVSMGAMPAWFAGLEEPDKDQED